MARAPLSPRVRAAPHAEPAAAAHRIPRARDGARERVIRAHVLNAAPSSMCLQVPEVLRRLPVHHLRTVARRRVPNARLRVRESSTRTNVVGFSAATHPTRRVRIVDHLLCSVPQCTQPLVPQHSLIPLAGAWHAACPRQKAMVMAVLPQVGFRQATLRQATKVAKKAKQMPPVPPPRRLMNLFGKTRSS